MRIIIDNVNHEDLQKLLAVPDDIARVAHRVGRINQKLDAVLSFETREAIDLTTLISKVAEGRTLNESIKVLVEELGNVDSSPAVQALVAKLKEQRESLAAAVQANT